MIEPGEDLDPLIIQLYNKGLTYAEISKELEKRGCFHCTSAYVLKRTCRLRKQKLIASRRSVR